ncbi:hypothetical protein [Chitinophaga nivalis]|uniref:DUF4595 domain-containing protein n=1 Tax=Chitinophaga nivalis TaxID=2991709 RepID=A0ABT3IHJ5_9BACT|nr:hypothetical protein [Chitinophaga nivalis]MCW3466869.1 hypothetical protein [Chitinophaga nivalis]MCW3483440.1 hypothetical protein [Chitinophaga nivalis]
MHNKFIAQGAIFAALLSSVVTFSSFRPEGDNPHNTYLHKVSSPAGQMLLEYNADKTIKKIVQQHKTENASYSDVQLPVYENGRLVKSLLADDEQTTTGDLYLSFDYAGTGDKVAKISYYRDGAVYAYDSLVYNNDGKLATRYQFSKNAAKNTLENNGYQEYTWNEKGDVSQMDNYAKLPGNSKFMPVSSVSYTYDNRQNPQLQHPELASLLDATAPNLSAHNVLSESISTPHSSRVITNTYSYAYNAGKYPVRGTFSSGMDQTVAKMEWVKL